MSIVTRFTVVTEAGLAALAMLTRKIATEKFKGVVADKALDRYMEETFNTKSLIAAINDLSNQWLVVYADDEPAGYAVITPKGKKPDILQEKRSVRIADFGILEKFNNPMVFESLFQKCMIVCKSFDAVWINEYFKHPHLRLFEEAGFQRLGPASEMDGLPLISAVLIREKQG